MNPSVTRIFPCPFDALHCDVFVCTGPVKWYIGDPTGPEVSNFKVCDDCARAIIAHMPDELIPEDLKARLWEESEIVPPIDPNAQIPPVIPSVNPDELPPADDQLPPSPDGGQLEDTGKVPAADEVVIKPEDNKLAAAATSEPKTPKQPGAPRTSKPKKGTDK